jgi:hypothetical protein
MVVWINGDPVVQPAGAIVRAGSPGQAVLAQGDQEHNSIYLLGVRLLDVAPGGSGPIAPMTAGMRVRMDAEPSLNAPIFLSSTQAGIATTTSSLVYIGIAYAKVNLAGTWYADVLPASQIEVAGAEMIVMQERIDWDWLSGGAVASLSLGDMNAGLTTDAEIIDARLMVVGIGWPWKTVNNGNVVMSLGGASDESRLATMTIITQNGSPAPTPIGATSRQGTGNPWEQDPTDLVLTGRLVDPTGPWEWVQDGNLLITVYASRCKITRGI